MKKCLIIMGVAWMAVRPFTAQVPVTGSPDGQYYQKPPRLEMDTLPSVKEMTRDRMLLEWATTREGTTEAFFGTTPGLEMSPLRSTGSSRSHLLVLPPLKHSQLYYIQPFSVSQGDTAMAPLSVHITPSASGGEIRTLFTASVDTSVSLGLTKAEYLPGEVDDVLIGYIDEAGASIDMAIYNLNNDGISNITEALNRAHDRGIRVRLVYDSNASNYGLNTLNPDIGKIASPLADYPNYGLMHNKFVIFDAQADDPMKPLVWTGSTNFTDGQINLDPNNVIVIQDQSLAIAYELEFNEMFGSEGALPDPELARFGPDKTDNTPHEFLIDGKRVECYFSPSDGTHQQLLANIASADYSVEVATMLITRQDIGDALIERYNEGKMVRVLINDYDQYGEPVLNDLLASLGENVRLKGEPGLMHHKYMIVDQEAAEADPLILTGSHNWSSSAAYRNDENTLIIHDQGVANAYFQEFVNRFAAGQILVSNPGKMLPSNSQQRCVVFPNPASHWLHIDTPANQIPLYLRLIDATGRQLREGLPPDTRSMDIGGLPPGIYYLHITLDKGVQSVHKIIVIR